MYSSSLPADTGLWPLRLRGGRVIFSYFYIEIPPHFFKPWTITCFPYVTLATEKMLTPYLDLSQTDFQLRGLDLQIQKFLGLNFDFIAI